MEGPRHGVPNNKSEKRVFKAAVVDVSNLAEAQARDTADHRMTESKEDRSKGFLRRVGARIWKHNIAQEYYRQKEIHKARKEIKESGNLYAAEGEDENKGTADHARAMEAVVERFTSEYEQDTLRDDERESKVQMESGPTNEKIKNLIRSYAADPTMTPAAFTEERNRILSSLDESYAKEGAMYADNLLSIATEVRSAVMHGTKLNELDFEVNVTLGKARESLNSETKKHTFDSLVEKLQNSSIGKFVANEPAALLIAAGVYSGAKALGLSALRSNVAKLVTFGGTALAAGGIAAAKESARLERERVQHMRERAKGMTFEDDDMKRREGMEENRYETKPAAAYIAQLEQALTNTETADAGPQAMQSALATLVEVESRIKLGDRRGADLISYSSAQQVEVERTKLDLLRAKLKVNMRRHHGNAYKMDDEIAKNVEEQIEALAEGEEGMDAKDKIFKKMKHRKVAAAALKTMAIGAGVGLLAQEVVSAFDSEQTGLVDDLRGVFGDKSATPMAHATALESLRRWISGDSPRMPLGHAHEILLGKTHMTLPENSDIVQGPNGTYTLTRDGQPLAEGLKLSFDHTGNLSDEARTMLAAHDIHTNFNITTGSHVIDKDVSAAEFLKHTQGTSTVHRELWYDNDTPHPFDKNELRTHWAGEHATGIDKNGNYVLSMQHMMPNGSYHDGASVDAQKLMKAGKLKMLFSLSRGTQHQPFEVPIDEHGNIVVAKGSAIAKLMFEERHGHAVFTGKFGEIAQTMGPAKEGGETVRILGTLVGKGKDMIHAHTSIPTQVPNISIDVPDTNIFDIPPVLPFSPRRPLERGQPAKPTAQGNEAIKSEAKKSEAIKAIPADVGYPIYYYHQGPVTEEEASMNRARMSPALRENPDANLDASVEAKGYFERQEPGYLEEVKKLAEQAGSMDDACKVAICIPVAGHQEGDNIRRTLSAYLNQTADPKSYEIVLFVNQPDVDPEGKPVVADKTTSEIEQFRNEHPELNVRVMTAVLPRSKARIGEIRKMLNDATLYRSSARTVKDDLVMVSNDADTRGLAPEYVENFAKKFETYKESDAMLGQLDWDPESYIRNPLIHVGTRLFQYAEIQVRRAGWFIGSSGANFAFRSSVYAAVGGYRGDKGGGEDTDLGERIKMSRQGAAEREPIIYGGAKVSRVYTSSRRAEKSVHDGLAPIEQWAKGFSAFDDEVRKTKWELTGGGLDYKDPELVKRLTEEVEVIINRTLKFTENQGYGWSETTIARCMKLLGIKYEQVGDSEIRITDASRLLKGLEEYQEKGMAIMARKTGAK